MFTFPLIYAIILYITLKGGIIVCCISNERLAKIIADGKTYAIIHNA